MRRSWMGRLALSLLVCCFVADVVAAKEKSIEERVLILANSNDSTSLELAQHYARRRGIPEVNILAFPMPAAETISWREFTSMIWDPLIEALVEGKWLDAIPMNARDAAGRQRYSNHGHHISYLVVCRGVPLRIANDPLIIDQPSGFPMAKHANLQSNQACVDSELSVLALDDHPCISFIPNLLFSNERPTYLEEERVVKVARLDGPTAEIARSLVDRAIEAEKQGLTGRAYVDAGGPYPEGDAWFHNLIKQLDTAGFDKSVDRDSALMSENARFDEAVLYFGWYSGDCRGPMAVAGYRFPDGAIAHHLHSASAATLRDPNQGWCAPLLAHGATVTFGNVFEPYLTLCQRPDLMLRALLRGARLGDAAYYATPALSWQSVLIGDPLYRPFPKTFDQQWQDRGGMIPRKLSYLSLRKMHLMENQGDSDGALAFAQAEMSRVPSVALALGVASGLVKKGQGPQAAQVLQFTCLLPANQSSDWPLLIEAARIMASNGDAEKAVEIYSKILASKSITKQYRRALLVEGLSWVRALGNAEKLTQWNRDLFSVGE